MVSTYALPFIRKAAILMHVRYGVDLPHVAVERADEPELARLSSILRLPSLSEIFASFAAPTSAGNTTRSIVGGWIRHLLWVSKICARTVYGANTDYMHQFLGTSRQ